MTSTTKVATSFVTLLSRIGRPLDLLINKAEDGFNWISHGSAADVTRQQAMEAILDKLTEEQSDALKDMTHNWVTTQQGTEHHTWGLSLAWIKSSLRE